MNQMYDFSHPVFKADRRLIRLAREHAQLTTLVSDVINIVVAETISPLRIPIKYHVEYLIKSIVGIDNDQRPIYGNIHTLEITLPEMYPLEGCRLTMLTDAWHPNIKSDGRFKGRVCGNSDGFGINYDLYQLVLRVGEILQYKNYHAIHTPPYPEDTTVAEWVINFAEPNGIVDKAREIWVDDTPLIRLPNRPPEEEPPISVPLPTPPKKPTPLLATQPTEAPAAPAPAPSVEPPPTTPTAPARAFKITLIPKKEAEPAPKIVIKSKT